MFINKDKEIIPLGSYEWEGVKHPPSIFRLWSDEELSSVGVFRVEFIDTDIPEGKQAVGYDYTILEHHATASPILEDTPVYVPESVSRAQGKSVLVLNNLWDVVVAFIESIEDETEKALTEIAFYDTNEWQRNSPSLSRCAGAIGLSEEDLDNLFIQASGLSL